ncbi:MAG: GyrI-like domain-containing protein [Pseudomonadota bacterium]
MTLGIHYSDPKTSLPEDYRLDITATVDDPIENNDFGVANKKIPGGRCATCRFFPLR